VFFEPNLLFAYGEPSGVTLSDARTGFAFPSSCLVDQHGVVPVAEAGPICHVTKDGVYRHAARAAAAAGANAVPL
jgi:hypothetical protein